MITGNEPAMPIVEDINYEGKVVAEMQYSGLTIRQHFAAMAMQGLLSIYDANGQGLVPNEDNVKYMAKLSLKAADALINELNK
jgi:hypothetical protein